MYFPRLNGRRVMFSSMFIDFCVWRTYILLSLAWRNLIGPSRITVKIGTHDWSRLARALGGPAGISLPNIGKTIGLIHVHALLTYYDLVSSLVYVPSFCVDGLLPV